MDTKPETRKSGAAAFFGGKSVKVTKQYLRSKGAVSLTLTRSELDELADLVRAGHALLKGRPSISKSLRAAMSKLDVDTKGL